MTNEMAVGTLFSASQVERGICWLNSYGQHKRGFSQYLMDLVLPLRGPLAHCKFKDSAADEPGEPRKIVAHPEGTHGPKSHVVVQSRRQITTYEYFALPVQ